MSPEGEIQETPLRSEPQKMPPKGDIRETPPQNRLQGLSRDLQYKLESLKSKPGVIGYILRDSRAASVDIRDPAKIIDYALLASTLHDAGASMMSMFDLGRINNILVEGKTAKVLSMRVGDTRLSIFMNKKVDHDTIYKDLRL